MRCKPTKKRECWAAVHCWYMLMPHVYIPRAGVFQTMMSFRVVTPCFADLWGASQLSQEDWLQTATRPWMQSSTTNQWDGVKKNIRILSLIQKNILLNSYFIWYKVCVFLLFLLLLLLGQVKKWCVSWNGTSMVLHPLDQGWQMRWSELPSWVSHHWWCAMVMPRSGNL